MEEIVKINVTCIFKGIAFTWEREQKDMVNNDFPAKQYSNY